MFFLDQIWLIPLLPAVGALIQLLWGRKLSNRIVSWVSVGLPGLSFAWAAGCFGELLGQPGHAFAKVMYSWLPAGAFHLSNGSVGALNVNVGFQYISFWLTGRGAAAINSLMEDAATAEISRSQIWQWIHHGVQLQEGPTVTRELVRQILDEETAKIREAVGDEVWRAGRPDDTREIFEGVALSEELIEFLTIVAYEYLD